MPGRPFQFARTTLLILPLIHPLFLGCGDADPKGPTSLSDGSEGTGSSTAGSTGDGATGDAATGSTGAGSTGGAPVCESSPDDSECNACNKMNCCAQIDACQAEPACDCMTGCVTGLADISMCTEKCGTSKNFSPLTQCGLTNCASECT